MSLLEAISRLATAPTLSSLVEYFYQGRHFVVQEVLVADRELLHPQVHPQLGVASVVLHLFAHPATGLSAWRSSALSEQTFFHSLNLWP